ncbi:MAG: glycosyltransferase family 4 protein [Hyphomicrobiaceae bacterium]
MSKVVRLRVEPRKPTQRLRIVHCLRAPVGGLFRHVRDLARAQAEAGHAVGIICDLNASDPLTEERLRALSPTLALGLHKVGMSREIGPSDISATRAVRRIAEEQAVAILHGHGAKGGAFARLAARGLRRSGASIACFYTPHGGSLHYDPRSLKGRVFMAAERSLMAATDGLIFESAYAARVFAEKVGTPTCRTKVIYNGVLPEEIVSVVAAPDAADFVFVGELRMLKGVDVLIDAVAMVAKSQEVSLNIVGAGPDEARFRAQIERAGLSSRIRLCGAMPAREAFKLGRALVLPSRAESLPYVALEAAGAVLPLIATRVGGIPEIVAGSDTDLVPPGDAAALAEAMGLVLASPIRAVDRAGRLQQIIADRFTVAKMTAEVLASYEAALAPMRAAG